MASSSQVPETPKNVCIVPHLGLGDAIVLNGLVRAAATQFDRVILAGKKRYLKSLESLFGDIRGLDILCVDEAKDVSPAFGADPKVLHSIMQKGYGLLLLGDHSGDNEWKTLHPDWSKAMYVQAGLSYSLARSAFKVSRNHARELDMLRAATSKFGDDFVLIHDDPSQNLAIPKSVLPSPVVHVDDLGGDNIFDYAAVVEAAREFHGIDSCFLLMIDYLGLRRGKKTVCHLIPGKSEIPDGFYATDIQIESHNE